MVHSFMIKRVFCLAVAVMALAAAGPLRSRLIAMAGFNAHGAASPQDVRIEQINIKGLRRIPESTAKIWISSREGDVFTPAQVDSDIRALYAQGHFSDVKVYQEDGNRGGKIITFEVLEFPLILDIKYE